jgi:hypothetical protein
MRFLFMGDEKVSISEKSEMLVLLQRNVSKIDIEKLCGSG